LFVGSCRRCRVNRATLTRPLGPTPRAYLRVLSPRCRPRPAESGAPVIREDERRMSASPPSVSVVIGPDNEQRPLATSTAASRLGSAKRKARIGCRMTFRRVRDPHRAAKLTPWLMYRAIQTLASAPSPRPAQNVVHVTYRSAVLLDGQLCAVVLAAVLGVSSQHNWRRKSRPCIPPEVSENTNSLLFGPPNGSSRHRRCRCGRGHQDEFPCRAVLAPPSPRAPPPDLSSRTVVGEWVTNRSHGPRRGSAVRKRAVMNVRPCRRIRPDRSSACSCRCRCRCDRAEGRAPLVQLRPPSVDTYQRWPFGPPRIFAPAQVIAVGGIDRDAPIHGIGGLVAHVDVSDHGDRRYRTRSAARGEQRDNRDDARDAAPVACSSPSSSGGPCGPLSSASAASALDERSLDQWLGSAGRPSTHWPSLGPNTRRRRRWSFRAGSVGGTPCRVKQAGCDRDSRRRLVRTTAAGRRRRERLRVGR